MASSVQEDDYINILLVGGTGKGKSSTGNSILESITFYVSDSTSSVTKDCQIDYAQVLGGRRKVKVVDTPGLSDTDLSSAESIKKFSEAVQKALLLCPKGFDGILIVIDFSRLGDPEKRTLKELKSVLNDEFVQKHAILVVTHGDHYDECETEAKFEDWCRNQGGLFKEIMTECGGRVVLFDNETTDAAIKEAQLKKLFAKVDEIGQSGQQTYVKKDFDAADPARQAAIAQAKESEVREGFMKEIRLIMRKAQRIDVVQLPEVSLDELAGLQSQLDNVHSDVGKVDNGTGACQAIMDVLDAVEATIKEKKAGVQMTIANDKRKKEIQEQLAKMGEDNEKEKEKFRQDMEEANRKMDEMKDSFEQREREAEERFRATMQREKDSWLDTTLKLLQVAGPLINTYLQTRPHQTFNIDARQWHYTRSDMRQLNRMNLQQNTLNYGARPGIAGIPRPGANRLM